MYQAQISASDLSQEMHCVVFALLASVLSNPTNSTQISARGKGCPNGSFEIALSELSLTIIFDKYFVSSGPGSTALESFSFCDIRLELPSNLELTRTDFRGFASLSKGVNATWITEVRERKSYLGIVTEELLTRNSTIISDSSNGDFLLSMDLNANIKQNLHISSRNLFTIRTRLQLTGNLTRPALAEIDSIDGKSIQRIHFNKTKKC